VPDEQLLANIVWAAGSRVVRDVWVGGECVVASAEPLLVDVAAARQTVTATVTHLRGTR
jgi:5-methylthioadenosine/S-adenosylhomocysteine deaminase